MINKEQTPIIGINEGIKVGFVSKMANRHGLITGATGTGKTVTLQQLTETFSEMGVPVFVTDIKGDFSGISQPGGDKSSVTERVEQYKLNEDGFVYHGYPVCFWDVFGEQGHPIRTTISEIGPLFLERLLSLNEVQGAILSLVFKIADDNGLLLLDLKDLQKMLEFVGNNRKEFTTTYGNISVASIGAIQRSLMRFEQEGMAGFFGEPALDINDFMQVDGGKGVVNILASDRLMHSPRAYTTTVLWLLSHLFETLPEVGDPEKPKLVFFFDEAHLLFRDMNNIFLDKIDQIVRLIRSKGVGVYFVTQNPMDIPERILGQLGNRVQHALRAYTPNDAKAVRVAARTFRPNPEFDTEEAITSLNTGEALVSFLDRKGAPQPVQRVFILPPQSRIGSITEQERSQIMRTSLVYNVYEKEIDRESAFEILTDRMNKESEAEKGLLARKEEEKRFKEEAKLRREAERRARAEERERNANRSFAEKMLEDMSKQVGRSVNRQIANKIGKSITRGIFGTLFGK